MTKVLPRTNFNSSRLARFLADLAVVDVPDAGHAFADRLGQWLNFNDALTLYAAHENPPAGLGAGTGTAVADSGAPDALRDTVERVRQTLTDTITRSCSPQGGGTRLKLPTPQPGVPLEIQLAYEPYRRFHLAHQRDIDGAIRPLRAQVRQALSQASPTLKKLATLDAAFDQILSEREARLLATVPSLLQRRYEHLLQAHHQATDGAGDDDPQRWTEPGGWLAAYGADLREALLAELDLRLQPTLGLLDAYNETKNQQ